MNKKQVLIFVHVPKTAGGTFTSILTRCYGERSHYIDGIAGIRALQQMPETERAKIDLLQGHFSYGIHQYIPRPAQYITFLRDPVERVLSLYHYILRNPENHLHTTVVSNNISLADFVKSQITPEVYNFQVGMIAGVAQLDPNAFPTLGESTLSLAKQRLDSDFKAFGLTERFDESLLMINRSLGWPFSLWKLFYKSKNVALGRKTSAETSSDIVATIRQNNDLDLRLYEYACSLFKSRIETGLGFRAQLLAFRFLQSARAQGKPSRRKFKAT